MKKKFNTDNLDDVRKKTSGIKDVASRVGITFNSDRKMVNTIDSHCLIELARSQGKCDAMVEEIFDAYFQRGEDINNKKILNKLAEKVGVTESGPCLDSGAYRENVIKEIQSYAASGITRVPYFTIRVGAAEPIRFAGAQSTEYFVHVLSTLLQVAAVPSGSRVRINNKIEGTVVSFQRDQCDFFVKLSEGDNVVRASYEKFEVLQRGIAPGAEVELTGLTKVELNGKKGEVVKYHTEQCRYEVRLRDDSGTKALRGDNLVIVRTLLPGCCVELVGLNAAGLNGLSGEVLGYQAEKGRFEVRLQSSGQVKAIRSENLLILKE